jgi:hypothetical protein
VRLCRRLIVRNLSLVLLLHLPMEVTMADNQHQGSSTVGGDNQRRAGQKLREAASQAANKAGDAASQAKQAAGDAASNLSGQAKELLDRQIASGSKMAGQFARSARIAAKEMDTESPAAASLMRGVAGSVESYASTLQDQNVDQLVKTVSDYTRRNPAIVFGLAALAGFFVLRGARASGVLASPPTQPDHIGEDPFNTRRGAGR